MRVSLDRWIDEVMLIADEFADEFVHVPICLPSTAILSFACICLFFSQIYVTFRVSLAISWYTSLENLSNYFIDFYFIHTRLISC